MLDAPRVESAKPRLAKLAAISWQGKRRTALWLRSISKRLTANTLILEGCRRTALSRDRLLLPDKEPSEEAEEALLLCSSPAPLLCSSASFWGPIMGLFVYIPSCLDLSAARRQFDAFDAVIDGFGLSVSRN